MASRYPRLVNCLYYYHRPRLSSFVCRIHGSAICRASLSQTSSPPRPPSLPKPQLDIKHIRENPGLYEINCQQRNYTHLEKESWRILDLHQQWLNNVKEDKVLYKRENDIVKRLGELAVQRRKRGVASQTESTSSEEQGSRADNVEVDTTKEEQVLKEEGRQLKSQVQESKRIAANLEQEIHAIALQLPNLASSIAPIGEEPQTIEYVNIPPDSLPPVIQAKHSKSHVDIGLELDILDIPAAATISGWGFYFLKGAGALLEHALIQHAMSKALAASFTPIIPPSLVYQYVASAAGYQPRDTNGERQIYELQDPDADELTAEASNADRSNSSPRMVLTGTSEIALASMFAGRTLPPSSFPIKHVALSRCYRAEAGGRGRDTKGLYRVHEFSKVELFAWTLPDHFAAQKQNSRFNTTTSAEEDMSSSPSEQMLQTMLNIQKDVLAPLNIPLRILLQPTADLGASAALKYDIEAFFPSRSSHAPWGELSSLSLCTDYQSRRMGTRIAVDKNVAGGAVFPYTLNGTAIAIPRVIAALLENGWDEKARVIRLPECLWGLMGMKEIGKVKGS
jgi:seryl-tRNA synthetase